MKQLIIIFCFLQIIVLPTTGQDKIYNFLHFTEKEGLSSNQISGLSIDQDGLLWISGKRGLSYFDGLRFVDVNENQEVEMLSNYLGKIAIDQKNRIWITTNNRGLLCFDRRKPLAGAVKSYYANISTSGLIKTDLYDVIVSKSGLIYFGGQETDLQCLDPETGKIQQINIPGLFSNSYLSIYSLKEDLEGNIWIGTRYHGLISYDPRSKKVKQLDFKNQGENAVSSIAFTSKRMFAGYYDYDLISFLPDLSQIQTGLLSWTKNSNFYDNFASAMAYWDTGNKVIVGHNIQGISTYEVENQQIEQIGWGELMPELPKPARINVILPTKDGYWLGSESGLFYYAQQLNIVSNLLHHKKDHDDPILSLMDWKGEIWYRTAQSFGQLSADYKNRLSTYSLKGLQVSNVSVVGSSLYFSTFDKGVFIFEKGTTNLQALTIYGPTHNFEQADCNSVVLDSIAGQEYVWIGSWNSGLYRYDTQKKTIQLFDTDDGLPNHKVITVGKDHDGQIWLGMDGFGLVLIQQKEKPVFKQFFHDIASNSGLTSNTIFTFYRGANRRFWFSNGNSGIAEIIKNDQEYKFEQYPDTNPYPWLYPTRMMEQGQHLWIKALDGTMLYDLKNKQFIHLIPGDGIFPGNQVKTFNYFIKDQQIIWCTDHGLIYGNLKDLPFNQKITEVPTVSKLNILHKNQSYRLNQEKLFLNADESNFSLSFSSMEQAVGKQLKFAYQLKGYDPDWVLATTEQQAHYNNLDAGNYVFQVKVGDRFGNWSDVIYTKEIHLKSYWYKTWWFKYLLVLVLLSSLIMFFVNRIQVQKKVNKLQLNFNEKLKDELERKMEKIKEQDMHIERENQEKIEKEYQQKLYESELKAIRSQMNPHFIFNILNSIEAYVVENDSKNASNLIQKFATLTRIVLENSQFSMVSIQSELQLVRLYLELEQLRFNQAFHFSMEVDPQLALDEIKIPSMLIQPLVENAIHHGVRHLIQKKGEIKIVVRSVGEQLFIEIFDNGVGFNYNAKKSSKSFKSTSFGIKGIQERIHMINSHFKEPVAYLKFSEDELPEPFSTLVTIVLPLTNERPISYDLN